MTVDKEKGYVVFTEEMKKTHTILVPNMLPMHFKIIGKVMEKVDYRVELLETSGQHIAETGLKYVHNDTCYPAILVIGSSSMPSRAGSMTGEGGADPVPDRRRLPGRQLHPPPAEALEKAGYGYVPVISLSMTGLEKHPGFQLNLHLVRRMMYGVLYGDLLMTLVNQTKPYEVEPGSAQALADQVDRAAGLGDDRGRQGQLPTGEVQL